MIELDVESRRKTWVINEKEPARYLVLGDFGGRLTEPVAIDRDNFDLVVSRLDVSIAGLRVRELEDFHPDRLFQRLGMAPAVSDETAAPSKSNAPKPDIEEILRPKSLLEQIAEGGDPFDQYVKELAREHAAPVKETRPDSSSLTERMNAILHHPRFQLHESSWRGINYAVRHVDDDRARIHLAQFSKDDLLQDLAQADDLRATRLYALLQSRRWTAVIGLFSFGDSDASIGLLGRIALIAAAAHAPFITEGAADMGPHWEELCAIPEASYLGLALPRLLMRLPYGARGSAIDSFEFEELAEMPEHGHYLWGNAALGCLAVLARGEDDNLNLEDLPSHTYKEGDEWVMKPCAEVIMTETQVLALIDQGMMPLVSYKGSPRVRLAGFRAINGNALPLH